MSKPTSVFDLPLDVGLVPDDQFGVYSFRLCLPNDTRLGLSADADISDLCTDLVRRAERLGKVLSERDLVGHVTSRQAAHLRHRYALSATPTPSVFTGMYLRQLITDLGDDLNSVRAAAAVLRYALELSTPIYVGMTSAQSFRERLEQHISGATQFSDRLKAVRVSWSDLQLIVKPLHVPGRAVSSAERFTQAVLRPKVSIN